MSDVTIMGGGVSGLTAGIYALLCGHTATVIEKNKISGGNLTGWQRGDYYIDNCIHWLTGTNPRSHCYRIWEDIGMIGGIEIYKPETLYTVELNGQRLSLRRDLEQTVSEMLSIAPQDAEAIFAYKKCVRALAGYSGLGECRCGDCISLIGAVTETAGEFAERFTHPLLKLFITGMTGRNFSALGILSTAAHFTSGNADLPRGGSRAAALRIEERFKAIGGNLMLGSTVTRINTDECRAVSVSLEDGNILPTENLIISADPFSVFGKMIGDPLPNRLERQVTDRKTYRFSCWQSAFAIDSDLLSFKGDLICGIPEKYTRAAGSDRIYFREFSHEPTFAPIGKTVLQTMVPIRESSALDMICRSGEAYKALKSELFDTAEGIVSEILPQFSGRIDRLDLWTPATYKRYFNSPTGSFMGFIMDPGLPRKPIPSRLSGYDNIYLATQWQSSPGGLPIAAEKGLKAIKTLNKRN